MKYNFRFAAAFVAFAAALPQIAAAQTRGVVAAEFGGSVAAELSRIAGDMKAFVPAGPAADTGGAVAPDFDIEVEKFIPRLGDDDPEVREKASGELYKLGSANEENPALRAALRRAMRKTNDAEIIARLRMALERLPVFKLTLTLPAQIQRGKELKGAVKVRNLSAEDQGYLRKFGDQVRRGAPCYFIQAHFMLPITPGGSGGYRSNWLEFFPTSDPELLKDKAAGVLKSGESLEWAIAPADGWNTRHAEKDALVVTLNYSVSDGLGSASYIWLKGGFQKNYNHTGGEVELPRLKFSGEAEVELKP